MSDSFDSKDDSKQQVKGKALSAMIWKVAERLSAAIVVIVVQIVLARLLGPEDFGLIAIVLVFTNLATVLVQCGMNTALVRQDRVTEVDKSTVFWTSSLISAVLYAAIFFCAPYIESFYGMDGLSAILRVLSLVLFVCSYNSVQVAMLQRELNMRAQLIATLVASALSGTISIALALVGFGVWALVSQTMLQQIFTCICMAVQVKWHPRLAYSVDSLKRTAGFGWKLLVSSLLHTIYTSIYDLVAGKVFSAAELGLFSQGKKYPAQAESILDSAISQVVLPAAARLKGSTDDMRILIKRGLQMSLTIIAPFMVLLCLNAGPLISILLGEQWIAAAPFFQVFCIASIFTPATRINLQCFNAMGRSDIYLRLEVVKKTIAIALVVIASLAHDLMLMAFVSLIYSIIAVLINMTPSKTLFEYGILRQFCDLFPPICLAVLAGLLGLIPFAFVQNNILQLVFVTIVFCTSYIFLSELWKPDSYIYSRNQFLRLAGKIMTRKKGQV
ncbi:lipopolysaccharide biosynthesis protein [Adlercreutzia sp. ZJ473]|uniref:lipopolysaccharide biosynthesis protein n=1 Tax=Adlercreutzia sp. ZJ473 TaxID=2722822 RepID=UPI0020A643A3|nr:lipopolysaccharide biosynthesis protein [Adlercreutzia sp. ZJ473]